MFEPAPEGNARALAIVGAIDALATGGDVMADADVWPDSLVDVVDWATGAAAGRRPPRPTPLPFEMRWRGRMRLIRPPHGRLPRGPTPDELLTSGVGVGDWPAEAGGDRRSDT